MRKSWDDIHFNTKLKIYPRGMLKETVCSKAIFKEPGWEEDKKEPPKKIGKPKNMSKEVREDSVKRAKEAIFDIATLNEFTHFVTWTLNKEFIDRYDTNAVRRKLRIFLDDMKKRNGLVYLIIAELHKDGAIHLHGLIKGKIELKDSGHKTKDGKAVYNMPQWKIGYSTAIELTGERNIVAKYITKYVSKNFRKIFGSFYYAGGKGIKRKPPIRLYNKNYEDVNTKEYFIPKAGIGFKYQNYEVKL